MYVHGGKKRFIDQSTVLYIVYVHMYGGSAYYI